MASAKAASRAADGVRYRVGADIGGTFTDIVLLGTDGSVATVKVSSTPDDYGRAIVEGIAALLAARDLDAGAVDGVVHATTVATNTILEMKGARTACITTEGFRDVLEMRRLRIPEMYNLQYEKPPPLVPRRDRFEVAERTGPKGEVWQALDEKGVEAVARELAARGIESLAICLLNSYANPDHEHRIAALARGILGEAAYITCSADILPEIREYERTSTTVVNAYIGPIVRNYLGRLAGQLSAAGLGAPLHIMQSNGGSMGAAAAVRKPAYIVESGPAAGVIACARLARHTGNGNLISLDMGGTTAKAAMVERGEPAKTTEYEVGAGINLSSKLVKGGGYAIKLPFIDVSEIGAGGGSIVSVGASGALTVGPRSAGAVPGPVCYDIGGTDPTFTDAMVALGYLNADYLLGGAVRLNAEKALRALADKVARPLGKPLIEAAFGVYTLAGATMTRAVKAVSTYRGRDPRDFVLLAFGGSGPLAAVEIARELGMRRVLIPPAPGVFSAFGLLFTEIEHTFLKTFLLRGAEITPGPIEDAFRGLEAEALAEMADEGYPADRVALTRFADMRYAGQAYELTVPLGDGPPDAERLILSFGDEHERTYGHRSDTDPVDLVNAKVVARGLADGPATYDPASLTRTTGGIRGRATRKAYFGPEGGLLETPVIGRGELSSRPRAGPLIVEEYDATCLVPPGTRAALDGLGNIDIRLE